MVGKKSSDSDLDIEQNGNAHVFLEDIDKELLKYLPGYEIQDTDLFPKSFFKPSKRDTFSSIGYWQFCAKNTHQVGAKIFYKYIHVGYLYMPYK